MRVAKPVGRVLILLAVFISGGSFGADKPNSRPNVLVWMMDDVGFAQVSAYGGLVKTPNIDRVAANGLTFSNYHTAPICSAARASFLTGRMPHSVHIGGHATAARDFPGYDGKIPASAGTLAENLRQQGAPRWQLANGITCQAAMRRQQAPLPTGHRVRVLIGFMAF